MASREYITLDEYNDDTVRGADHFVVFSKDPCVQCNSTYLLLDKLGVEYVSIDISKEQEAFDYVKSVDATLMQAPIVFGGGDYWQGFNPLKIKEHAHKAIAKAVA